MAPRRKPGTADASSADAQEHRAAVASPEGQRNPRRQHSTAAAAAELDGGHGGEPVPHSSKKRRTERIHGDGGTTSAAAAAAGAVAADADEGAAAILSPARGAAQSEEGGRDRLMDAVVKVFTVHSEPNFSLPWQRKRQYASSGSGFVIAGRKLLSNAHVVDHHTQVRLRGAVRCSELLHLAAETY